MESLQDILGDKNFSAPDEITAVKTYIKRQYQSDSHVKLDKTGLVITVPSSALAGTLRLEQRQLVEQCKLKDRKIFIRIG